MMMLVVSMVIRVLAITVMMTNLPSCTESFSKKIFICLFVYLAALGLSCGMWDLLVVACM